MGDGERLILVAFCEHVCPTLVFITKETQLGHWDHCCALEVWSLLVVLGCSPTCAWQCLEDRCASRRLLGTGHGFGMNGLHRVGRELAPVGTVISLAV